MEATVATNNLAAKCLIPLTILIIKILIILLPLITSQLPSNLTKGIEIYQSKLVLAMNNRGQTNDSHHRGNFHHHHHLAQPMVLSKDSLEEKEQTLMRKENNHIRKIVTGTREEAIKSLREGTNVIIDNPDKTKEIQGIGLLRER